MSRLMEQLNRQFTQRLPLKPARSKLQAPLASITFDDFAKSSWTRGGEILRRRDVKGTYYVAGGFSGRTADDGVDYFTDSDLVEVAAAGHEIGCHTFSHQIGQTVGSRALMDDVERNAAYVQDVLGDYVMSSFAYPYGEASPRTKLLFGDRFPNSRGIKKGVNRGIIDLSQLKAIGIEKWWWTPEYIQAAVDRAKAENAWLIFFTHDISDEPSPFGATPQMLEHALDALKAAEIETLPVKHALARAMFN
jgi:peptidoglycan/xylan/chitin deacetylase (PgdA/CDA1 family)